MTSQQVLQEAFALSDGEATSLVDVEGGFIVAGVEKITPRGYKNFELVRQDVEKLWQREQQKSSLKKTTEDLLTSVKQGKGWGMYNPTTSIISSTQNANYPEAVTLKLMQQKIGEESVALFQTEKGTLIAYVKRVIPSTEAPTVSEQEEAIQDWALDLEGAVQKAYAQNYPIEVHTNTIQKAFSIYDNQEE